VNTDEIQGTAFTRNRTNGITAKEAREIGTVQNEGTEQIERGNIESLAEEKRSGEGTEGKTGNPTEFVKYDNSF
jgi:hypothetical protein